MTGTPPADQFAAGYAEAVRRLRDDERYRDWWTSTGVVPDGPVRGHLADYLETVGPQTVDDAGKRCTCDVPSEPQFPHRAWCGLMHECPGRDCSVCSPLTT
jgi:hypothetical protein